ncbi:MAG: T9SS type A sorting domain-containing protein [Bacteroidia bacterium]
MKKLSSLLMYASVLAITIHANGQTIPNADFENWTNGNPNGWSALFNMPPILTTVTQSSDKYSGNSSVKFSPFSYSGYTYLSMLSTTTGIATNSKPAYLNGYIKANISASDSFIVETYFTSNLGGAGGAAYDLTNTSRATWTPFHVTIIYQPGGTVDSANIIMYLIGSTTSAVYIDALSFSNTPIGNELGTTPTGVKNISPASANSFVTPNPVDENSQISFFLSSNSTVTISLYDVTGRFIKTVLNDTFTAGVHEVPFNTDDLRIGIYFYTLSGDGISETKKFVVNK